MQADVKRQIADKLLELLEKKSLEKITVKELVTLCGISRQTFYYHFEDVLDVVDWWTRQGAQQLMEQSMRTEDPSGPCRRGRPSRSSSPRLASNTWPSLSTRPVPVSGPQKASARCSRSVVGRAA